MPTNGVLYWYLDREMPDTVLERFRSEILAKFQLSGEDFYSPGPLVPVGREDYDLADLEGAPGFLFSVNLVRAYYGVGYERGYLPLFVHIAEWLEANAPGSKVYYGNDENWAGELFGAAQRERLMRYYASVGSRPYDQHGLSEEESRRLRDQFG